ncbi:hypothetical protein Hanom_Chr08g00717211 [Helianthus anomalus]
MKTSYSSQDNDQRELLGSHSDYTNIDNTKSTSSSCENMSDKSLDKVNKCWFRPLIFSLGFTLFDNLLRSCFNQEQVRYLRHFGKGTT